MRVMGGQGGAGFPGPWHGPVVGVASAQVHKGGAVEYDGSGWRPVTAGSYAGIGTIARYALGMATSDAIRGQEVSVNVFGPLNALWT